MTSKQVTSPPWNSRRLVHSKEMAWASRWSVALRAFYKQILSSSNCKDFFFKWHRPPRKLAKEVFVKFIPAKEKTRFAKEWRKVLAKDHVIRIDSHEVFNTAQLLKMALKNTWKHRSHCGKKGCPQQASPFPPVWVLPLVMVNSIPESPKNDHQENSGFGTNYCDLARW